MERPIIEIDEEKCDGCGQCVLDCAEGALAVVDGKARLIRDSYCDGLGACLNCPREALRIVMRAAEAFDEKAALAAKAAREGQKDGQGVARGCPGSLARSFVAPSGAPADAPGLTPLFSAADNDIPDSLRAQTPSWPVQLRLLPPGAPFLRHAHILLAAQCAGFVLPTLHDDWLQGRIPVIACPKLDNTGDYPERLAALFAQGPASVTVLRMSVPCCAALEQLARKALEASGCHAPLHSHVVRLPR